MKSFILENKGVRPIACMPEQVVDLRQADFTKNELIKYITSN